MHYAIAHLREGEEEVAAETLRQRFPGFIIKNISFTCPYCGEPVVPAALELGGIQSPHFRHRVGSEKAHNCEKYESWYGPSGPRNSRISMSASLPMYISPLGGDRFALLVGLSPVDDESMQEFQKNSSQLVVGTKLYTISRGRFPSGKFVRLEYGLPDSLKIDDVTVMNAPHVLRNYWSKPEPMDRGICLFSRDGRTGTGSRIARGGKLFINEEFYCVASPKEAHGLASKFSTIRKVGEVTSNGGQKLYVYICVIQANDKALTRKSAEIEELGYLVAARNQRPPRIVWPPCVKSYDEYQPLFRRSAMHLLVETSQLGFAPARSVNVVPISRLGTDSMEEIGARTINSKGDVVAVVEPREGRTAIGVASLLTTSDPVIVDFNDECLSTNLLKRAEALPRFERNDTVLSVHALIPYDIVLLRKGSAQLIKVPDEMLAHFVVDEMGSPTAILVRVTLPGPRPGKMNLLAEVAVDAGKQVPVGVTVELPTDFMEPVSFGEIIATRRLAEAASRSTAYVELTLGRLGYRQTLGDQTRRRMEH